jgi:ABC-type amino acid transport system permease subunit
MSADAAPFPVMSIAQCDTLMTAPGAKFEMEEKVINGIRLRTYKHAPQTLRDVVLNSKQWDFREYLVFEDERVSYGAHYKAVAHLARRLREDFGVQKGDRIAVVMRNYPQWAVGFWAALAIGAIAIGIASGAYSGEVIRGAFEAVPKGQIEAAATLGLSYWQTQRKIVLPQALAMVVPGIMNNFIAIFKDTSLVTIVSLYELTGALGLALNSDADWRPFKIEGYLFIALIYFIFCFSMSRYSLWVEKQVNKGKQR